VTHTNPNSDPTGSGVVGGTASATARIVRAEVTSAALDTAGLASAVADPAAGAIATFDGRVRNHDDGRGVTGISYSAHPGANEVIGQIVARIAARDGLRALAVAHRVGELEVGETALAVAVSADHRASAFSAVSDIVEEVKARLPVWKQQVFADGSRAWSNTP